LRFAVDELRGADGIDAESEGREVVEMLAELPDLWDVNVSDWPNDSKTSRLPNDELAQALGGMPEAISAAGIVTITSIGDCFAPSTIAAAVYAGHRHAREFDWPPTDAAAFRRELPDLRGL
jgi:dimethylamine/trimethylamine dehydrogenase